MSISAAISNAVSGLSAVSRGTEIVASNIANALTPGYGARELELSPRSTTGGVQIVGVNRQVPLAILSEARGAKAQLGQDLVTYDFQHRIEAAVGSVNMSDSLLGTINAFQNALTNAAATPESGTLLQNVHRTAHALADKINAIADTIQSSRSEADHRIASDVERLNNALAEVSQLNRKITVARAKGQDSSGLEDVRQATIAAIADIVPLQEVPRNNGQIALFTRGGATLLDGIAPAKIEFSRTPIITPQMSFDDSQLGGLTFNGTDITGGQMTLFSGGSLAAAFEIRDNLAPGYQAVIDSYAADLYRRTATDSVDPTIPPDAPGLFTDQQTSLSATGSVGFANRLRINSAIDPVAGGILSNLRDGLYGVPSPNIADGTILTNLHAALLQRDSAAIPRTGVTSHSATSYASDILSFAATDRVNSEYQSQRAKSYSEGLDMMLAAHGVDSDREIERLILLEKAYAANAKVIQAANDMLDQIMRLS